MKKLREKLSNDQYRMPSGKALFLVTKNEDNTFEFAPLSDEAEVILQQYEEEQRKLFNN